MDGKLTLKFLSVLNVLDDRAYIKAKISYWAAPTLLGKKPATILALRSDSHNTYLLWESYKEELERELNICYLILRDTGKSAVVLFYNQEFLQECLTTEKNKEYLLNKGYPIDISLKNWLLHLKTRFQNDMPHEIGIFLGIPLEDVDGFVQNQGEYNILIGDWKVYHNPEKAEKMFREYDAAREKIAEIVMKNKKGCYFFT